MQLSSSVPIIIPGSGDPLGVGWVTSQAHPDGNLTGFTLFEVSLLGKSLALLKQIAPAITRVAFIHNPDNPNTVVYRRTFENAAGPLAVEPVAAPVHSVADIERALASLADRQDSGVLVPPDITILALRDEAVDLLARRRLPAIYSDPAFVKVGGLASYGPDRVDLFRRSAAYVDRILRGEKPGDLPFQQPTKHQLTLNLKAAKALGLELSPTVLALADEVTDGLVLYTNPYASVPLNAELFDDVGIRRYVANKKGGFDVSFHPEGDLYFRIRSAGNGRIRLHASPRRCHRPSANRRA